VVDNLQAELVPVRQSPLISFNSTVRLNPLSQQVENGVLVVGRNGQFLELPTEGAQFIAWLEAGLKLAEARARFEARYNPFPDQELTQVMQAFLECDFLAEIDGQPVAARHWPVPQTGATWFPRRWAQALFSRPMLIGWMALSLSALILWLFNPELWPRHSDYFWSDYYFLIVLVGILVWISNMAVHELFHWLACRAKGIEASITWTQRLGFFPMSQTVMHDIWAVPRQQRFLPLAAGMIWDIFKISLLIILLYLAQIGLVGWSPGVIGFLKFFLLVSVLGLTSQFWLFSKMDGYFLLSALLGQRNLQSDTYSWLRSKLKGNGWATSFTPPAAGMKFIYIYGVISVVWGGLFLGQFLVITVPIKFQLLWESLGKIGGGLAANQFDFADGVAVLSFQVIYWGLLAYAYWRDTWPTWHRRGF
jgi:putative peptide zinc metalloprotease protein